MNYTNQRRRHLNGQLVGFLFSHPWITSEGRDDGCSITTDTLPAGAVQVESMKQLEEMLPPMKNDVEGEALAVLVECAILPTSNMMTTIFPPEVDATLPEDQRRKLEKVRKNYIREHCMSKYYVVNYLIAPYLLLAENLVWERKLYALPNVKTIYFNLNR